MHDDSHDDLPGSTSHGSDHTGPGDFDDFDGGAYDPTPVAYDGEYTATPGDFDSPVAPVASGGDFDGSAPTSPLSPQTESDEVLLLDDLDDDGTTSAGPDASAPRPPVTTSPVEPPVAKGTTKGPAKPSGLPAGSGPIDPASVLSSLSPTAGDQIAAAASAMLSKEPVWAPAEYVGSGNFGGSAVKLSESFVSPLVAAARGYKTYNRDMSSSVFKDFNLGDRRTSQGRRLMEAVITKDALLMPWYAVDEVWRSGARAEHLDATSIQFRPSVFLPGDDPDEKKRKYEFITGNATPLAVHPSTPSAWIDQSPTTLIAEGLLKADAALTGWLLHMGVTREQLSYTDTSVDARLMLTRLLNAIPEEDSLTICSIAGVYNWQQNPEWKMVSYTGREVWLGIDGDVAVNPYVWRAASQFKEFLEGKKHARVSLLSPRIPAAADDGTTDEKIGIDDYLAYHGTWESLLVELSSTMPPRPADATAKKGDVRVSKDGCMVQQYNVVETDAMGQAVQGRWDDIVPLGGRIVATLAERLPSEEETRTGEFGRGVDVSQTDWEVEIEVKFKGATDEVEIHTIAGPAKILNYLPDQWEGKGADIPAPILVHPEWPPRGKDGEAWLKAIKSNQPDQIIKRVRWASMGWVPVPGSIPAFIAGEQVIGGNEDVNTEVLPGVSNEVLDRASGFGLGPDFNTSFEDESFRADVKAAIEAMLEVYVTNGTWRDRRNASVVVAAGLRPALPLHMKALPYFVGARGTGKTFSAEACMGFWQSGPSSLLPVPGSAKDSAASMELALSRALIWTIDDVAPTTSKRQSEEEKDKIGNLIRNYFNRTARGRATADMKSRKKNLPRAMLVITAENEPTVSSERDRVILCDIGYGALSATKWQTDMLSDMIKTNNHEHSGAPTLVSQALVKFLRFEAARLGSWGAVWQSVQRDLVRATKMASDEMKQTGGTKRHADTAADLVVALLWLRRVAEHVECEDWVLELVGGDGGMMYDVIDLISEGQRQNNETSPGRALVEALSATLRRGRAHIALSDDPTAPPMPQDKAICTSLGWVQVDGQNWRPSPNSDAIGWLMHDKKTGPFILFDPRTAFQVAQQNFPTLIPHGQQERSSWAAVSGEKLGRTDLLRKTATGTINRARIMQNSITRNGYPIDLDRVLNGGSDDHDYLAIDMPVEQGNEKAAS